MSTPGFESTVAFKSLEIGHWLYMTLEKKAWLIIASNRSILFRSFLYMVRI